MAKAAARTELRSQPVKSEASGKVWVAFHEVWWYDHGEGVALHQGSPSLALRGSAEPVFWSVQAPATLAPPPAKRLTSRCARNERREVRVSTVSVTKSWQRIGRSNTMRQQARKS